MAGRPLGSTGVQLTEEHRSKIRNSKILSRLIGHAEGTEEMSATQVSAGLGLLKKALPDLSAVELSGAVEYEAGAELRALMEAINGRNGRIPNDS